ncbi:MXAN_2561 family MXYO-CTERM-anchored protein [Vitiosangium sp. GDMCC 1.1324]|uniref:MXAN_2561 family MXYO-CTERM-anchored protein n=1 Tax=Vitiosangium sp. (strain GDMCC 1.1324) TaxID=2138576 RepID=UPI000D35CFFA|nr:MXAN_2561 family MXYO-CTERM-anchored protein [Vitiosangium sp. GDMCC 1.1324]PTL77522.1 hypothetical protein DAT35_44830 [Vitiosangium sp. GDMCC 1.1324]
MRTLLIAAVLLCSSAAFGQTILIQSPNGTATVTVGPSQCGGQASFKWTVSATPCSGNLEMWLTTDTTCKDSASDQTGSKKELPSLSPSTITSQNLTGTLSFNVSDLPIFSTTDGGQACGAQGIDATVRLCASARITKDYLGICATTVTRVSTPLTIAYDTLPPAAPTITSADGLDQAVVANVSTPDGASQIELEVQREGAVVKTVTQRVGKGSIRVEGLENGVTYQLVAFALDEADNKSAASEVKEATPIKTKGFLEVYADAGGEETGGCGAAGGGVVGGAVLAVLGFWLSSRRNRS